MEGVIFLQSRHAPNPGPDPHPNPNANPSPNPNPNPNLALTLALALTPALSLALTLALTLTLALSRNTLLREALVVASCGADGCLRFWSIRSGEIEGRCSET